MKRLFAVVLGFCIVGSVLAQSSFTIVRPADGSKVREKVRVMIPKDSLEEDTYVGVFLNGKFVEAVVPPVQGNYRVYTLDTKIPRGSEPEWRDGIPDGEMKLELVKYQGGDSPKVVDRSSVTVTVGNHMNIAIPQGGVHLGYGFHAGQSMVYDVHQVEIASTLSGVGNENGGRPAQFPSSELNFRILYAVDNTYGDGNALLRLQDIPDKGKDYSILSLVGIPEPQQIFDYQMQPIYMRVDKTARPIFGSAPPYFGFSSGSAPEGGEVVYGSWPLPVLPDKPVYPGCPAWQTAYLFPLLSIDSDVHLMSKVAEPFPARGEFIDAEWELGHPCAKIRNSIAEGTRSLAGQALAKQGKAFADDKVALDETIFFSLDTHKILRLVRTLTVDHKVEVQTQQGGSGMGGPGVGGGAPTAPSAAGAAGGGGALGAGYIGMRQGLLTPPGNKGRMQGQNGNTGMQAPGRGGTRTGGAPTTRTQYLRQVFQQTFTLEQ